MLRLFRRDTLTPQTERIYKVPLCIQDTIPIYRIAENGIFELESPTNKDGGKKKLHQFDRMYLFEDIQGHCGGMGRSVYQPDAICGKCLLCQSISCAGCSSGY